MMNQLMTGLLEQNPPPDRQTDQMGWVRHMNMLQAQAEEVVIAELVTVPYRPGTEAQSRDSRKACFEQLQEPALPAAEPPVAPGPVQKNTLSDNSGMVLLSVSIKAAASSRCDQNRRVQLILFLSGF